MLGIKGSAHEPNAYGDPATGHVLNIQKILFLPFVYIMLLMLFIVVEKKVFVKDGETVLDKMKAEFTSERSSNEPEPYQEPLSQNAEIIISKPIAVAINPPTNLNFMTKKEIYALRKEAVNKVPELAPQLYSLRDDVFVRIEDKKPWWGLYGLMYYGPGEKSIEGPSGQSRHIINPYMLVDLDLGHSLSGHQDYLKPALFYPFPLELTWSGDRSSAKAKFNISAFWKILRIYAGPAVADRKALTLIAYNARDFGYNYLAIDFNRSFNIFHSSSADKPVFIKQYIHNGNSCGYPGGCNNMSPDQPELRMEIIRLPAIAAIKLWKDKPSSVQQPADVLFIIDMI
jgi:hypothetical protein